MPLAQRSLPERVAIMSVDIRSHSAVTEGETGGTQESRDGCVGGRRGGRERGEGLKWGGGGGGGRVKGGGGMQRRMLVYHCNRRIVLRIDNGD